MAHNESEYRTKEEKEGGGERREKKENTMVPATFLEDFSFDNKIAGSFPLHPPRGIVRT
jgi:hypothetical protein